MLAVSRDRRMAQQSLKEERAAVRVYSKRIRHAKDARLKRALIHARKEEREHAASFKRIAPSLGMECNRSSRLARGTAGALMGGFAGGVLGLLVGSLVLVRKIGDGSPEAAPINGMITTTIGVTALGVVAGSVAFAWAPEC